MASTSPDLGWTPDENAPNYDDPVTGAVDMWYEPVSTSAGVNDEVPSGVWAGYTDEATLRSGLPLLADGTAPAIFRLETKNLFKNGDFEANDISASDMPDLAATQRARVPTQGLGDARFDMQGNWMQMNFTDGSASILIGFASNVAGHINNTIERSYSLSFRFVLDTDPTKYLAIDNSAGNSIYANALAVLNSPANNNYRFPFTVFTQDNDNVNIVDESSIVTSTSGEKQYLVINPQPSFTHLNGGAVVANSMKGSIDDIQMVRSAKPNAIRLNIPLSASNRPILQQGGTYTVKVWVRSDQTSNYSGTAAKVNNRFAADFLSISLHPYTSSTNAIPEIGAVVTSSRNMNAGEYKADAQNPGRASHEGWTDYASWGGWTLVSSSFSGRLAFSDSLNDAFPLQLAISATNMDSATFRSPGSILIANPELFWSPD